MHWKRDYSGAFYPEYSIEEDLLSPEDCANLCKVVFGNYLLMIEQKRQAGACFSFANICYNNFNN